METWTTCVKRGGVVWLLAIVAGIVMVPDASAQGTTASIVGQVSDGTGGILPGVTVTATSPALQVPQVTTVTDAQGEYRLAPLPIGTYALVYELSGFQSLRREGVRLTVGFEAKIDIALSLGSVAETITVSGASPLVDVMSSATSTEQTREALEALPTTRDGLKAYLAQVPGVQTNFEVGNSSLTSTVQFKVYGQSGQSWQMLDGVLASAPWGAGNFGSHFEFNSIEGTRVQTVGSNAEMPRRGMFVDSVLRSGGNEYHGSAVVYGSSHQFEANNVDDDLLSQGVQGPARLRNLFDVSGNVGGKIVPDRLWFYGAARRLGFDRDTSDAFYDDGRPVAVETAMPYAVGKLSYQMTESQRLSGFYHYTAEQLVRGAGFFTPIESREIVDIPATLGKVEWQGIRGNSLVISLLHGFHKHFATYNGMAPGVVATTDIVTQRISGDRISDGRRWLNMRRHTKGVVTWYRDDFAGKHEFKAGVDHLFSRVSDRRNSRRSGNYQLVFSNGNPFQINTFNYPVDPKNDGQYIGAYLQDSWTVGRRLTLNVGLRFARDSAYAPQQCREAGDFAAAECFEEIRMPVWNSFAPRLHAAWDVFGDARTVLKGGWGRFDHLREIFPELTAINRNNATTTTWDWRDLNGNRDYDPGEVNLNPNGGDFRSISGATDGIVNPDEKQPKEDEFSLTFERQLLSNWAVRVSGIYAKNFNTYRLAEVNRPYDAYSIPVVNPDPGPDGRVGTADDPGTFLTYYEYPASLSGRQFAGTMLINDPRADHTFKTIEIATARRLANGWQMQASFTATKVDIPFGTGSLAYNPNAEINSASTDVERDYKVSGGYTFPYGVMMSVSYNRRRGAPQARQVLLTGGRQIRSLVVNAEPLGSRRLPSTDLLDMRLAKRFALGGSRNVEVRADIFNVLNINTVTSRVLRSGNSFLFPTQTSAGSTDRPYVLPRILQMGATFNF